MPGQPLLLNSNSSAAQALKSSAGTTSGLHATLTTRPRIIRAVTTKVASMTPPKLEWRRPYSPGPLTAAEFEQYWSEGYVIKSNILTLEDLQPCLAAIERRVDEVGSHLLVAGLITDPCSGLDVFSRLTALEQQFPEASVLVHKDGRLPMEFAALWSHPTLLGIAQQLLGPDVGGHPSWNLRAKTPRQEAGNVPWHQDSAYCHPDSWNTLQVTAWVPLLDVDSGNGCMQLLRGGHQAGKTVTHTGAVGNTWYLAMDEAAAVAGLGVDFTRDVVTAAMKAGDVLLFNNLIPHRSLDNTSSSIRWSLDLRWQHPEQPDGAFGVKRTIRMTQPGNPNYTISWEGWVDVDKKTGTALQQQPAEQETPVVTAAAKEPATAGTEGPADATETTVGASAPDIDSPLSTILVGPWLGLWPITHENKHTVAWKRQQQQQQ